MKTQPQASMLTLPGAQRAPAPSVKRKLALVPVLVAALILAANIGWYLWLGRLLGQEETVTVSREMINAEKLLGRFLSDSRRDLESRASMIADDARLRAAIPVPEMDEATMSDLLQDIAAGTSSRLVALLGPDGGVRGVAGKETVQFGSLASTAVFRRATSAKGPVSGLWILAEHPFHVALAPVRFGERDVLAYVLVGSPIAVKRLELIEQVTKVSTAIGTGDRILLASTADPIRLAEIQLALANRPPTSAALIVKKDAMEEAGTPSPVHQLFVAAPAPEPVRAFLWLPVLTAIGSVILALGTARRSS